MQRGRDRRNAVSSAGRFSPADGAVLDMDFRRGFYFGRELVDLESGRGSSAFTEDAQGDWIEIRADTPRRTTKGVICEYGATNAVQNSWLFGASVGGSLPVGWASSVPTGASLEVVGLGTYKGLPYIDVRLFGTATAGSFSIRFGGLSDAPAGVGENWVCSAFVQMMSTSGLTDLRMQLQALNASSIGVDSEDSGNVITAAAEWSRPYVAMVDTPATTAKLVPLLMSGQQDFSGGVVLDEVIRIAVPQLEEWAPTFSDEPFPTSPVRTTVAPASRSGEWLRAEIQSLGVSDQATFVIIANTPPEVRKLGTFLEWSNWFDEPNQFGFRTSADGLLLQTYHRNTDIESTINASVTYPGDGERFCAAFCFVGDQVSLSLNGGAIDTVTASVSVYDALVWLSIGGTWGGVHQSHGFVERVIVFNDERSANLRDLSDLATWGG